MTYLKSSALAIALGLTTLATGCATVTGGTHQSVSVRTAKDSVDVTGANCVLTNSEGTYEVTTPGQVAVHRARGDLSVTCTKPGETTALASVSSSIRKGALAGNIALLGVLSVVSYGIDKANGSAFYYPDEITVTFGNNAASQSPPDAQQPRADSTASTNTLAPLAK